MRIETAVQALVDAGVEFVLIGGWAAILNGSVRTTRDLDICYARTLENHRRLAAALSPFLPRPRDFPMGLPFIWDATTLSHGTVFTLATTIGSIDLLAEVSGLGSYQQVKASAKLVDAFDRSVWTLDLRGLIDSKRAAGRPKDLQALPELESLLETLED
jgi:hypothetical protein